MLSQDGASTSSCTLHLLTRCVLSAWADPTTHSLLHGANQPRLPHSRSALPPQLFGPCQAPGTAQWWLLHTCLLLGAGDTVP